MIFELKSHFKLSFYAVNILIIEAKISQNFLQNTKMILKVPEGKFQKMSGGFSVMRRV